MHIEEQGIVLYPLELRALIRFAAKAEENPLSVVHFRTERGSLVAYSTSGQRALQATGGMQEGCERGEWTVSRRFLSKVLTALETGQFACLQVSACSLHGAVIRDARTLEDVCEVSWHTDAAFTQMNFPIVELKQLIQLPATERPVRCASVNAEYLSDLTLVARAAGSSCLDLFPGKTRQDPLTFRITGGVDSGTEEETIWFGTEWMGVIAPIVRPEEKEEEIPLGIWEPDATITVTVDGEERTARIYDFEKARKSKKKRDKQTPFGFEGDGEE